MVGVGHLLDVMSSTQMRCMLRDGDLCAAGVEYLSALLLQPQPCAAGSSVGAAAKGTAALSSDTAVPAKTEKPETVFFSKQRLPIE